MLKSSKKLSVEAGGGGDDGATSRTSQHPSQLETIAGFSLSSCFRRILHWISFVLDRSTTLLAWTTLSLTTMTSLTTRAHIQGLSIKQSNNTENLHFLFLERLVVPFLLNYRLTSTQTRCPVIQSFGAPYNLIRHHDVDDQWSLATELQWYCWRHLMQVHLEGVWVDRRRNSSCLDSAQLYLHNASTHHNFGEVFEKL